jgi:hypothetical protein
MAGSMDHNGEPPIFVIDDRDIYQYFDFDSVAHNTLKSPNRSRVTAVSESGYVTGLMWLTNRFDWFDHTLSMVNSHAFLGRTGIAGVTDLGSLNGDSVAYDVNNLGVAVGRADRGTLGTNLAAVVFADFKATDLNTLVANAGQLRLVTARFINDQGDIAGEALLGNEGRVFLFRPLANTLRIQSLLPRAGPDDPAFAHTLTMMAVPGYFVGLDHSTDLVNWEPSTTLTDGQPIPIRKQVGAAGRVQFGIAFGEDIAGISQRLFFRTRYVP